MESAKRINNLMTHIWLRPFPQSRQCSNEFDTALAQSVKSQFAVKDIDAYKNSKKLKEYQVEVVTFDGESETVYVEAHNEAEASDIAAAQVGNADYTMVYSYN